MLYVRLYSYVKTEQQSAEIELCEESGRGNGWIYDAFVSLSQVRELKLSTKRNKQWKKHYDQRYIVVDRHTYTRIISQRKWYSLT